MSIQVLTSTFEFVDRGLDVLGYSSHVNCQQVITTMLVFILVWGALFSIGSEEAEKSPSQQMKHFIVFKKFNFQKQGLPNIRKKLRKKKMRNWSSSPWLGMDTMFCFSHHSSNFSVSSVWAAWGVLQFGSIPSDVRCIWHVAKVSLITTASVRVLRNTMKCRPLVLSVLKQIVLAGLPGNNKKVMVLGLGNSHAGMHSSEGIS